MFELFAQQHADRSGLGLGLSNVQRAVQANEGHLQVRDMPEKRLHVHPKFAASEQAGESAGRQFMGDLLATAVGAAHHFQFQLNCAA